MIYFEETIAGQERHALRTNPATPQFPANTRWALVRRMCLIDDHGHMRATSLIESLQTRTYVSIAEPDQFSNSGVLRAQQLSAEFQLDRQHAPALRVVLDGERDFQFVHFRGLGIDLFELESAADWAHDRNRMRAETLRTCYQCHAAAGILSVNTYTGFGVTVRPLEGATPEREVGLTISAKASRYDWGLLQGLWRR